MIYMKLNDRLDTNTDDINKQFTKDRRNSCILDEEITDWDKAAFKRIINTELTENQKDAISTPISKYPEQNSTLAIHWHPEFVPMELITKRVNSMYPCHENSLIIPTNHNNISTFDNCYFGTEVDCFSKEFNRKVQLLVHFSSGSLKKIDVFTSMLNHTLKYRSTQLFELLDSILDVKYEKRVNRAAKETGATLELVNFVKLYTRKFATLLNDNKDKIFIEKVKNSLLPNYFEELLFLFDPDIINQAKSFVKAVKYIVKSEFTLKYFFTVTEIIEEARRIGAGIVVPHPEQFWPILMAEYDVDGYEVWNPQSREFTEFIIGVVNKQNRDRGIFDKQLLVFMGDDAHMGEKLKKAELQDKEKAKREIGLQPAWDDIAIQKSLCSANISKDKTINEYKSRLG